MNCHYYLNEDHTYQPCDLMTWAEQINDLSRENKRHIGFEVVEGKRVSTVWLGNDHNFWGGEPLLFETMVFDGEGVGFDIYMERYTTWNEAEEGHQRAIQWIKDGCKQDSE